MDLMGGIERGDEWVMRQGCCDEEFFFMRGDIADVLVTRQGCCDEESFFYAW